MRQPYTKISGSRDQQVSVASAQGKHDATRRQDRQYPDVHAESAGAPGGQGVHRMPWGEPQGGDARAWLLDGFELPEDHRAHVEVQREEVRGAVPQVDARMTLDVRDGFLLERCLEIEVVAQRGDEVVVLEARGSPEEGQEFRTGDRVPAVLVRIRDRRSHG